ncbi:MAG: hypothetical protein KF915_16975 [Polyangiaceae bacterium]|nr:hypothetical protein [Polyangiaceae bacterium]
MSGEAAVGLCARCVHARAVRAARSTFWLCTRSREVPALPKYPRLPVAHCREFSPGKIHDPG